MAVQNGVSANAVVVEVAANNTGVTVRTKAPVRLFFGKIFGTQSREMSQQAQVVEARPVGMNQLIPVGVDQSMPLQLGKRQLLFAKDSKDDDRNEINLGSGNFGALEFAAKSTGARGFQEQLRFGWPELISKGDILETKSGVKFSAVKAGLEDRLTRAEALPHQCSPTTCPPSCPRTAGAAPSA